VLVKVCAYILEFGLVDGYSRGYGRGVNEDVAFHRYGINRLHIPFFVVHMEQPVLVKLSLVTMITLYLDSRAL
jgi:hypothetical protein